MRLLAVAILVAGLAISAALLLNGRYRVMPNQRERVLLIDTLTGDVVSCFGWSARDVAFQMDCEPPE